MFKVKGNDFIWTSKDYPKQRRIFGKMDLRERSGQFIIRSLIITPAVVPTDLVTFLVEFEKWATRKPNEWKGLWIIGIKSYWPQDLEFLNLLEEVLSILGWTKYASTHRRRPPLYYIKSSPVLCISEAYIRANKVEREKIMAKYSAQTKAALDLAGYGDEHVDVGLDAAQGICIHTIGWDARARLTNDPPVPRIMRYIF
jgi:hypothetical protein